MKNAPDAPEAPATSWRVGSPLSVPLHAALAEGRGSIQGLDEAARERNAAGRAHLAERLRTQGEVYGVTTGFGDSCETPVRGDLIEQLPVNLFRFHGCGVGPEFSEIESRAIVLARLASLGSGWSAVRPEVLERLVDLLDAGIHPIIPQLGSVGASGDLTPLSYVAAVLSGEREVSFEGRRLAAGDALRRAGLEALVLEPKESLALMNGTSAMTGVASLSLSRALRLARWASSLTAACSDVLRGQPLHFDERIFAAKPHPGQARVAAWIRGDLEYERARQEGPARVQDRYSLRCAPHVIGVLLDVLPTATRFVEIELNGAGDNPLVDPDTGDVLHGGNFYGGHVCSGMDTIKTQVANVADLLDRQLALLCNPATNHGLPGNLVGAPPEEAAAHHGFKAMQITTSALAAEAARLCFPASLLSRSTENHNQDKVSMGTIAARDCARIVEITETVAAIATLAISQAVDLREKKNCHRRSLALHEATRAISSRVTRDRALDGDIVRVLEAARRDELPLGEWSFDDLPRG